MSSDDKINMYLHDTIFEEMDRLYFLKILGVSEKNLKRISDQLDLRMEPFTIENTGVLATKFCEFGSDRKQVTRLFAAALTIHFHFPQASMSLSGASPLKPEASLHLSAAVQLYLSQAGFSLDCQESDRTLSTAEMSILLEQFRQMAPSRRKRGA